MVIQSPIIVLTTDTLKNSWGLAMVQKWRIDGCRGMKRKLTLNFKQPEGVSGCSNVSESFHTNFQINKSRLSPPSNRKHHSGITSETLQTSKSFEPLCKDNLLATGDPENIFSNEIHNGYSQQQGRCIVQDGPSRRLLNFILGFQSSNNIPAIHTNNKSLHISNDETKPKSNIPKNNPSNRSQIVPVGVGVRYDYGKLGLNLFLGNIIALRVTTLLIAYTATRMTELSRLRFQQITITFVGLNFKTKLSKGSNIVEETIRLKKREGNCCQVYALNTLNVRPSDCGKQPTNLIRNAGIGEPYTDPTIRHAMITKLRFK
ncbi:MAG: hypothetical protein EZS28_015636 [Streblomastix strix]|uniref:Tyr recombinase domain-containing protein n=1 Tax=Streblomastix strix TaxID=222440 RepID=A0A5J4W209_9EUKA|nr:MAG: hypothetical protein EZS28_015636 [Streblomastix strix]